MARAWTLMIALLLAVGLALPAGVFAQSTPTKAEKTDAKGGEKKHALLDINTAPASELETLPGIGDAYSKKIVENRP